MLRSSLNEANMPLGSSEEINSTWAWVFCFSIQGFRSTGWQGGVLVSSPGRGPSGWDRAHCPLPVAGWSRSTPCPRAGRWSTPPRESDILWTTTRAPPPLKTPDLGLSQGKYSLSPSSQACFFRNKSMSQTKAKTFWGNDLCHLGDGKIHLKSEQNQLLFLCF